MNFRDALRVGLLLPAIFSMFGLSKPVAAQGAVTVEMGERGNEYFFEPKHVTVSAGEVRMTFRNVGQRNHNWVVRLPGGVQRTPDLGGGRTTEQTFTFPVAGTFEAICDLPTHEQRGMKMTLTVTGAAPSGVTGSAATAGAAGTTGMGGTTGSTGAIGTAGSAGGASAGGGSGVSGAGAAQAGVTSVGVTASPAGVPYLVSLLIHIPAAIAWLGIVLYDAIVAAVPFLTPAQRGSLLARPRWLVLATIPLFGLTGIYQTIFNPFGTITSYADLTNLRTTTTYGFALFLKHGFVFASMALTLAVTFYFAPKLLAFAEDTRDTAVTPTSMPSLLSWLNVAACVALLACVSVMVFQLH